MQRSPRDFCWSLACRVFLRSGAHSETGRHSDGFEELRKESGRVILFFVCERIGRAAHSIIMMWEELYSSRDTGTHDKLSDPDSDSLPPLIHFQPCESPFPMTGSVKNHCQGSIGSPLQDKAARIELEQPKFVRCNGGMSPNALNIT